jgi:predicted DNA-binding ribbon-helix-helix protein
MKSSIVKRSIVIDRHKTSVSLEDPFWIDLKTIAQTQRVTLSGLIAQIDAMREQGNLSSALRVFVLHHFRNEDKRIQASLTPSATVECTATCSVRSEAHQRERPLTCAYC